MRRRLPPLNGIRSFEAVGRLGSVAAAAKELLVTEPAVSRAVKNLEQHFGIQLFHRHASGLRLTEQGKLLLPEASSSLDRIAAVSNRVYEQRRYTVTILATAFIASRWLSKWIVQFLEENEDVSIRVHSSFRYEEFHQGDFDVAIWWTDDTRRGFEREPLFNLKRLPICSRQYLEKHPTDGSPSDLLTASLIHEFDYHEWMSWFEDAGLDPTSAARGFVSDNYEAILYSVVHGAGVAMLFDEFLEMPGFSEKLVAPFDPGLSLDTHYFLHYQKDAPENPAIKRVVDYLSSVGSGLSDAAIW